MTVSVWQNDTMIHRAKAKKRDAYHPDEGENGHDDSGDPLGILCNFISIKRRPHEHTTNANDRIESKNVLPFPG